MNATTEPSSRTGRELLVSLLRSQPKALLSATALATIAAAFELAPYWLVYRMTIEVIAAEPRAETLVSLATLILVAAISRLLLFGAANVNSHRLAFRVQKELRLALVRALEQRPIGVLEGRAGDLKKTLVDDVDGLEHFVAHTLPDAVAGLAVPLLAAGLLLAVDWRMALASLALLPVAFAAQMRAFRGLGAVQAEWHAAEVAANASLLSYVRGLATLKAYNRVASSLGDLRRAVRALADLADRVTRRTAVPYALFFVMLSTNLLVVLPVGLILHVTGTLETSALVLFAVLGAGLTAPLLRVLHAFGALEQQLQGATRIAAVLDAPTLPAPAVSREPTGTDIRFERVNFGYGDGADVLRDLSFTVSAGSATAIVGPSGAGKSTVIRLVARFWDTRSGTVRIGGVDVRDIAPDRLRDLVAVVFQDPFFFHGTIRENLEIAAPGASVAAMRGAMEAACLADLVASLPQGLDTPIGDRGGRLSGGERQRLAIARALLKDSPILLLDEATAFADPESEFAIQQAIARLTAGRTVLIVAHRLATVMDADGIAVLEQGRLEAFGRHVGLLRDSAVYKRLWDAQSRGRDWRLRA
jgi:ATP-binding cassette subfamily B protein